MRKLLLIATAALFLPLPVVAQSQAGYSNQCFKEVYREEYVPGTRQNPGSIRRWVETVEVPCQNGHQVTILEDPFADDPYVTAQPSRNQDDNSCIEGAIIGGLLGGGAGAAASRGDGRWWAVPLGIAGGSIVGCQVDGG